MVNMYPVLEPRKVHRAQGISFCYDRDKVDPGAEALHDLNVKRLQGMPGRSNEIEAGMNAEINLLSATGLLFLQHVGLVLIVQKLDDRLPGVTVVDVITETRSIDYGQTNCRRSVKSQQKCSFRVLPLKNFSSSSALVISISTVLSICLLCLRVWSA